jgi:HAD superfamily hydrolase (TIGR01549 family)
LPVLTPHALLLDFGGVIVDSGKDRSDDPRPVIDRIRYLTRNAPASEAIVADLERADRERDKIRYGTGELRELSHRQLWELIAGDWTEAAREAVYADATELTRRWTYRRDWRFRPGILDLLEYTLGAGIPVGVVSNTRCGQAHRDFLEENGIGGAFSTQVYSDEIGFLKPHPQMILTATARMELQPQQCWFVGDTIAKDVECARRAGAGAAILMRTGPDDDAAALDQGEGPKPDAVVADATVLLALVKGIRLAAR